MAKPWFFELLKVGTYYGTTECKEFFLCPKCEVICEYDCWRSPDEEPLCIAGYKCKCGYTITKEEVEEWTNIPYDPDKARSYRRVNGW
jgi:hypothetical protein